MRKGEKEVQDVEVHGGMDEFSRQSLCLCVHVCKGARPRAGFAAQSPACPCPQDCAWNTANCIVFSCPLYSFDRAAVLHVWGRLWNSTFLEVRVLLGCWAGCPPLQQPLWDSLLLQPPSYPKAAHA